MKAYIPFCYFTTIVFFSCLVAPNATIAQLNGIPGITVDDDYNCTDCKKSDIIYSDIDSINKRRLKSYNFYRTLLKVSAPTDIYFPFLDIRKTYNGPQKKPFILNADVKTPIGLGGYRWGLWSVHVIPQFKVRIFQDDNSFAQGFLKGDESAPVRTPSYMPRITVFKTFENWWQPKEILSQYIGFSAFHHSNGQDGQEFFPDGTINIYNGNFGEQVAFELIYGGIRERELRQTKFSPRRLARKESNKEIGTLVHERTCAQDFLFYRLGLEVHAPDILTNQDFLQYNLYGRYRINYEFGYSIRPYVAEKVYSPQAAQDTNTVGGWVYLTCPEPKEIWRLVLNGTYILPIDYNIGDMNSQSKAPLSRSLNIQLTAYWRIPGTTGTALFGRVGYYGSDQYNIYFQQNYLGMGVGLSLAYFTENL